MARHNYTVNNETNYSVERYRREIDRSYRKLDRDRSSNERRNSSGSDFKRSVQKATQPVQSLARDAMFHYKVNDPTTNEIRNIKRTANMVTGFAGGAALAIASVAVAAIKASDIDERSKRLVDDMSNMERDYSNLQSSLEEANRDRRNETLREYNEEVSSRTSYYKTDFVDKAEQKAETYRQIDLERRENNATYREDMTALSSERKKANESYQKQTESLRTSYEKEQSEYSNKLSEIEKARNQDIEDINKRYDNRIDTVKSSSLSKSEKDQRISTINQEREDKKQAITDSYDKTKEQITREQARSTSQYKTMSSELESTHNSVIQQIQNREDGAKNTYRTKNNELDTRARDSEKAFESAKEKYLIEKRGTAREIPSDPERHNLHDYKPTATVETQIGPVRTNIRSQSGFGMLATEMGYVSLRSLNNVRETMESVNKDLAKRVIDEIGSPREKELLEKLNREEEERRGHTGPGRPDPILTDDERRELKNVLKSYGGAGVGSEKDLKMSMENSFRAAAIIQGQLNENKKIYEASLASYKKEAQEVKNLRNQVTDSINARRMLAKGKDENGKDLTDKQKESLKKQLLSKGKEAEFKENISKSEAVLDQRRLQLNKALKDIKRQETTVAGLNKQNELLKRNGKALLAGSMYIDTKKSLKYKERAQQRKDKADTLYEKAERARRRGDLEKANKLQAKAARQQGLAKRNKDKSRDAMKKGSKAADKLAKKAKRKWGNSVRALQKRIEAKTLTGNQLHSELKHLKRGLKNGSHYYTMAMNGAIIITKVSAKMIFAPLTISNFIGKRLNAKNAKILGKLKDNKRLTRGEAIWQRSMQNSRFLRGTMRINTKMGRITRSRGFKGVTKFGKGLLYAPATVMKLPSKIMDLPQTMMMGAAKGTVKVAGKTVKLAARPLGRGVRAGGRLVGRGARFVHRNTAGRAINKIKNSRLGRAANRNFRKIMNKVAPPLKKAAQSTKNFFKKKLCGIRKLFGFIIGIIQAIFTYILMFFLYLLLFLLLLILVMMIVVVILALIFSVIGLLLDWLASLTAQHGTEIRNQPGFILHMASNYRSEELRIFYYFNEYAKRKSDDGKTTLEVSTNPLWFEVYDSELQWSDNGSYKSARMDSHNGQAEGVLNTIKAGHENKYLKNGKKESTSLSVSIDWNKNIFSIFFDLLKKSVTNQSVSEEDWKVDSEVTKYSNVWVAYLEANGDLLNRNGTANRDAIKNKLSNLGEYEGKFEISNAKDALACADAVYQSKIDECQTYEILAYLGVGATQPVNGDADTHTPSETLFWKSHNIVYLTGTSPNDIYYHGTQKTASERKNSDYATTTQNEKYYGTDFYYNLQPRSNIYNKNGTSITDPEYISTHVASGDLSGDCNNMETRSFSFTRLLKVWVYRPRHTHNNSQYWTVQAEDAITKAKDKWGSSFTPSSSYSDYWYWYEDIGDCGLHYENTESYSPTYTGAGNLRDFMLDLVNFDPGGPNDAVGLLSYPDVVHIKNCRFNKLYVISSNNGYLIAGKHNGKYYQVLSKSHANAVLGPVKNGLSTKINGSTDVKADMPSILILYRCPSEDDNADDYAYVPKIYYKRSTKDGNAPSGYTYSNGCGWTWRSDDISNCCHVRYTNGNPTSHYNKVQEQLEVKCNEYVQLCHGHITLRTAVIVTTAESEYSIFDKAAELPAQSETYKFHIYDVDKLAGVSGWGGVLVKGFDPAEDFAEKGSARGLAHAKAREKDAYYEWSDDYDSKLKDYYLRGVNEVQIPSIAKTPDNKVSWAMYDFQGHLYYTRSLKSGKQFDLNVYKFNISNGSFVRKYLSLETPNGHAIYKDSDTMKYPNLTR